MEIKIRELCKSYGKKKALQNFDATFENGIYGILGPNGAGKSTLMNILTDNLLRDSGRILCGGKDILKWGAAYRKSLGYMPQQQQLYETFTVTEFEMSVGQQELEEVKEKFEISNLFRKDGQIIVRVVTQKRPEGYDEIREAAPTLEDVYLYEFEVKGAMHNNAVRKIAGT